MTIIGFTGKAGAGKSTAAGMLIDMAVSGLYFDKAVPLAFADPIKAIARNHFNWDGLKDERGRRLLQVIGTEAGRTYDPDIWVNRLMERIDGEESRTLWVVDDIRFESEMQAIRKRGGHVFLVAGRSLSLGRNASHSSEAGVPQDLLSEVIMNDGSEEDLCAKMRGIAERYFHEAIV